MAKPTLTDLLAGIEGWDAILNDNLAVLRGPIPIGTGTLPGNAAALEAAFPAATYPECIYLVRNGTTVELYASNGTAWVKIGP